MGLVSWFLGGRRQLPATSAQAASSLELTSEFRRALELIEGGASPIFITGGAGTGKSALLQHFRKNTSKRVAVVAPTGMAAVNVRGATIHSFFKFPPTLIQPKSIKVRHDKTEMFRTLDTIVIDEISMVRSDVLDGIDWSLRLHTGRAEPFGGIQIVLFGDLAQLPPVVKGEQLERYFTTHYDSQYFFSAAVLKNVRLQILELTTIFRQAHDVAFAQILQRLRKNEYTIEDLSAINTRFDAIQSDKRSLVLTTTNKAANDINVTRMGAMKSAEHTYEGVIEGVFPEDALPADRSLRLKVGAQVMMLKNNGAKWVNGSIGKILRCLDASVVVALDSGVHEVESEEWEVIDYEYNAEERTLTERVIGKFKQLPLRLAWAITIHKSQGQTFDSVDIDMHSGAFAHGQLYVALSRCRSLAGLRLRKLVGPQDVVFDSKVFDKMQEWGLLGRMDSRSALPAPSQTAPAVSTVATTSDAESKRAAIHRAIEDGHRLEIEYVDFSGNTSRRVISPRGWFDEDKFSAYCHLRASEREFRVSRIHWVTALD